MTMALRDDGGNDDGHPAEVRQRSFPATLEASGVARQFAREVLAGWGVTTIGAPLLVVSELAANAIRHAGSGFQVELRRLRGALVVSVADASSAAPHPVEPTTSTTYGRGLLIVEALATDWGWAPTTHGKVVWAKLADE